MLSTAKKTVLIDILGITSSITSNSIVTVVPIDLTLYFNYPGSGGYVKLFKKAVIGCKHLTGKICNNGITANVPVTATVSQTFNSYSYQPCRIADNDVPLFSRFKLKS